MQIQGRVHNGVVVREGEVPMPEGTPVTFSCAEALSANMPEKHRRVQLPLVRTDLPGSGRLTAERVAELLEEDDGCPSCRRSDDCCGGPEGWSAIEAAPSPMIE
jgi:hypothetical protein